MYKEIQIRIKPEEAAEQELLREYAAREVGVSLERIRHIDLLKKAVDARQRQVILQLRLGVHIDCLEEREKVFKPAYRNVATAKPVIVVGAGPAGLFAALRLIERGYRPIVLERGKRVEERRRDLGQLYKSGW